MRVAKLFYAVIVGEVVIMMVDGRCATACVAKNCKRVVEGNCWLVGAVFVVEVVKFWWW